eukprot:CAMPEP_0196822142 /NCGR_PEP_ID=MMETSP1362-20130617/82280_1 /TAXON_ID=163516 /ORGANISM="Leptocylindrus danicus, Strain CCMP1856" /LENGTH=342 /DNA_ID=CAMNT_0042201609 /DNA_START=487 /DNA_END=1512 /DNA_ORIENTATION=+
MKDEVVLKSFGRRACFSEKTSGKIIDEFHKTCSAVISVFYRIKQLIALKKCGLDKRNQLIETSQKNLIQIQTAIGETLAAGSSNYEKTYEAFVDAMNHLDDDIHNEIDYSLKAEKSVAKMQSFLERNCKIICDTDKDFLNQKYKWLVDSFGCELYHMMEIFEQQKNNPERSRNAPLYFGNIEWAAGIQRRIDEPQKWFQQNGIFQIHDNANRIISTYNTLTKALSDYKSFWLQNWNQSIVRSHIDASCSVATCDSVPANLQVHMQARTLKLIQEAKHLAKHGVNLSPELQAMIYQYSEIDNRLQQLREIAKQYNKCIRSLDPTLYPVMRAQFEMIDPNLKHG